MAEDQEDVVAAEAAPPSEETAVETEQAAAGDAGAVEEAPVAEEPAAEEPAAEAPAADEAAAESEAAPEAAPEPVAAAEVVTPKERRRRKRAAKAAPTRDAVDPAARQAERDAQRAANAKARRTRRAKVRAKKPASAAVAAVEVAPAERGRQKTRQGVVVSDKASKTITVRIDTSRRHRRYQKIVRSSMTLHAHDEHDEAHEGDLVRVIETRPLSATKRWRLAEVVERAR